MSRRPGLKPTTARQSRYDEILLGPKPSRTVLAAADRPAPAFTACQRCGGPTSQATYCGSCVALLGLAS